MKIINLMENTSQNDFLCEHGLCIYVETKHHHLLIDTGQSSHTWENAKKHNIDLSLIDTIIISHGHYDHAGGLLSFLEINPNVKIYIHKDAILEYYSFKNGKEKYIGMDKRIEKLPQIEWIDQNIQIDEELSIFTNVTERFLYPKSNLRLKRKVKDSYVQDTFSHEMYVVIQENESYYLFSGCAHNGIVNILHEFERIYKVHPTMVITGFHLKQDQYEKEDIQTIVEISKECNRYNTIFCSGHCTGEVAFETMKEILKEKLQYMHAGDIIKGRE